MEQREGKISRIGLDFMNLYLYVTKDEYELPMVVADSARELADILGKTYNSVSSSISHRKKNDVSYIPRMLSISVVPDGYKFSGKKLKQIIEDSELAREEILYFLWVTNGTLKNWEHGITEPTSDHLFQLAEIPNVDVDDFFEKE